MAVRDPISLLVGLYVLISIVSGILAAARKRSQTQPSRGKLVTVPQQPVTPAGEHIPQMVLADFDEAEPAAERKRDVALDDLALETQMIYSEELPDVEEGLEELVGEDLPDSAWDDDSISDAIDRVRPTVTGVGTGPREAPVSTRLSSSAAARHLVTQREWLKAAVVAAEVLSEPRAVRMWTSL